MNRHQLKNNHASFILKLMKCLVETSWLLNLRRAMMRRFPFFQLQSRVKNIVYLSWLVDIEKVKNRYPDNIRLWEKQGKTIFTILSYQHEHFGFRFLGGFRKLMPSPKQSNWRFYLDPNQQDKTVIFEQVVVDQKLYVLSGRLASDAMPAQFSASFIHQKIEQQIQTQLEVDSTYQLSSTVELSTNKQLPESWQGLFESWDEATRYLLDQDHAWVEWVDQPEKCSQGDIEMPFDFSQIQSAQVLNIQCPFVQQWGVNEQDCFAVVVPELDFYVRNEQRL